MSFVHKSLATLLLLSAGLVSAASADRRLPAVRGDAFKVDGLLDEWRQIPFIAVTSTTGILDAKTNPPTSDQDLSFRFAVGHDADALYVAVIVTDDHVVADSCQPGTISAPAWDDDAVEIFLDGNDNGTPDSRIDGGKELHFGGEFSLIANGAAMSDFSGYPQSFGKLWSAASNYASVTNGTAQEMTYEFRMPWATMGLKERPKAIGFNLSVQDDDDGGRRDHALYWTGNPQRPFSDESKFGTITFDEPRQNASHP